MIRLVKKMNSFGTIAGFIAIVSISTYSMTFTDDHNDGDCLTGGGGWTVQTGTTSDFPEASGNITPASNNVAAAITNDNTFADDGVLFDTLTIQSSGLSYTNGCNTAGILFRWSSTSAYYYVRFERTAAGPNTDGIYLLTNTISSSGGTAVATGITLNNPFVLKIVIVGSTFTFFVDGTQVGQVTDATNSSGRVGYAKVATWDQQVVFYGMSWYDSISNSAPTDISLSPTTIAENQSSGTYIGKFTTTDPDVGDSHTYSLVAGTGDGDNTSVTISNDSLFSAASYNYESKSTYNIRVRTDDGNGGTYDKALTFTVTDANDTPSDILLSPASVKESQPIGTFIGVLSTIDEDAADVHTYSLVAGTGSTDNAKVTISNDTLYTNASISYATNPTLAVRIRSTDNGTGSLYYEKQFTVTVIEVEDINNWASSMNIYINTTASGANVANNVYNFPLLVRIDPSNFTDFANTNVDGADIRFTKSDGTFLFFEKEKWIDGTGDADTGVFWVKLDTVYGNNSEQFIKMWWNKTSETTTSNPGEVFATSDSFAAVYHLAEEATGVGNIGTYTDATNNGNDADDYVSATDQSGVAREGQAFDGTDDYISIPQATSLDMSTNVTISGWFKLTSGFSSASGTSQTVITKYMNNDNNLSIIFVGTDYDYPQVSDGSLVFKVESQDQNPDSFRYIQTTTTSWSSGTWYYFTVVLDKSNSANNKIYINGIDVSN